MEIDNKDNPFANLNQGCGCASNKAGGGEALQESTGCGCGSGRPVEFETIQAQTTDPPCCGAPVTPTEDIDPFAQSFTSGALETPAGPVPRIGAVLSASDKRGAIKARWGVGRMDYRVAPGLYALGQPDEHSPVLVSANYKLSFDKLRQELSGFSAWVLVLETNGINVWCAAGHGSFGTRELVARIQSTGLEKVVAHHKVIVPQLGAPGVAGYLVKRQSGFRVVWGPIKASDLPAFLNNGQKAEEAMRIKDFPLRERAVLVPVELTFTFRYLVMIVPVMLILGGLGGLISPGQATGFMAGMWSLGLTGALAAIGGVIGGAVLTPLALPWLPGRAFALKGFWVGLGLGLIIAWARMGSPFGWTANWASGLEFAAVMLITTSTSTFLGMNFTGSSTYTNLSGVKKEMAVAVPLEIAACGIGLLTWFGALYLA